MPDKKMSLENILNEYSPDNNTPNNNSDRINTQKILNSTIKAAENAQPDNKRVTIQDERSDLFDSAHRQPVPADEYKPADLSKQRISVVGKEAANEIITTTTRKSDGQFSEPSAPVRMSPDEAPKIRRMSDSTRAKEVV